jgi:hypothetical protein
MSFPVQASRLEFATDCRFVANYSVTALNKESTATPSSDGPAAENQRRAACEACTGEYRPLVSDPSGDYQLPAIISYDDL